MVYVCLGWMEDVSFIVAKVDGSVTFDFIATQSEHLEWFICVKYHKIDMLDLLYLPI